MKDKDIVSKIRELEKNNRINPLKNDSDALYLAKKYGVSLSHKSTHWGPSWIAKRGKKQGTSLSMNRAICLVLV